jgi:predicted unusual protein kinase regulating ubiquinone biosynthesis (AarF/ABC1/UbiB family)
VNPGTRLWRTWRVARTGVFIWAIYKLPEWTRRALGRPHPEDLTATHERAARAVLACALDMRGVIIKTCQAIATRSDVFPKPFVEILKQLHDAVPPRSFEVVKGVVEAELGKPLDAIFSEFDHTPLASASLAQVHRARLVDGGEVAVKVQYPGLDALVASDLGNVRRACRVYEFFDPQPIALLPLLTEITTHIGMELDFLREADSADRVRAIFSEGDGVVVPEMYRQWSAKKVLTMELVDGIKVTDKAALEAAGLDPELVVQDLMQIFVRMIFAAGFFQADPHPGNIMVRPNRDIVVLDFGLSKALPEGFGMGLFELMFSMMTVNESAMVRAFLELGFRTQDGDTDIFLMIAKRMINRSDTGKFEGEFTEDMTDELFEAIRENPLVDVPTDFVLVGRVFALLSGIAHTLGHRANVLAAMGATT